MSNPNNTASSSISINFTQPFKLDRSNYLLWKAQLRASIIANGLEVFINGESACPDCYLTETEESLVDLELKAHRGRRIHHISLG